MVKYFKSAYFIIKMLFLDSFLYHENTICLGCYEQYFTHDLTLHDFCMQYLLYIV